MSIATFAKGIALAIYPKLSALCNSPKAIAMPTDKSQVRKYYI
ncbi:hypothetical protein [Nostoc commune]|nr:hypothetical protein [Nostoc commune]